MCSLECDGPPLAWDFDFSLCDQMFTPSIFEESMDRAGTCVTTSAARFFLAKLESSLIHAPPGAQS
jgi:hypothetical protein